MVAGRQDLVPSHGGTMWDGPSAPAKHSSRQNIVVRLILGKKGIARGQRGASTRGATGFWPRATCTSSYPGTVPSFVRSFVPSVCALVKLGSSCARLREDVSAWTTASVFNVRTNFNDDFAELPARGATRERNGPDSSFLFIWHHREGH